MNFHPAQVSVFLVPWKVFYLSNFCAFLWRKFSVFGLALACLASCRLSLSSFRTPHFLSCLWCFSWFNNLFGFGLGELGVLAVITLKFPLSAFRLDFNSAWFPKIGNWQSAIGNTWRLSVSICAHLWLAFRFYFRVFGVFHGLISFSVFGFSLANLASCRLSPSNFRFPLSAFRFDFISAGFSIYWPLKIGNWQCAEVSA